MSQTRDVRVEFTGDAKTYFGIWIVNILLSLVTLGIYSAWAKVRTKRYFAQNTLIEGRRFDYHATGLQILIGRAIVVVGLILLSVPFLNIVALLALFFLFPWLMNRALAFNARMTSFSGLRFGFSGSYWGAFKVYMLYPFLSALTLYTTLPFAIRARYRYILDGHRFGTSTFGFESGIGPFYKAFGVAALWAVGLVVAAFTLLGGMQTVSDFFAASASGTEPAPEAIFSVLALYLFVILALLPAGFIYAAYIRQAVFAGLALQGGHRFASTLRPMALLGVALSNAVVVVLTLGLMLPWAQVRMARLMAQNTVLTLADNLDTFIGAEQEKVSALGDAYADIEGIDLGLAL